jgi:hypothetical protein
MSIKKEDTFNKDNSAQITLYLLETGAIDCQVEWFFPHDTAASDIEIDTLITLVHGLSGYMHTRFYEVFQMGKAIEAGLHIKDQMLSKEFFSDESQSEIVFTPDEDFIEQMGTMIEEQDTRPKKVEKNGKSSNIVSIEDFITTNKDPKKFH